MVPCKFFGFPIFSLSLEKFDVGLDLSPISLAAIDSLRVVQFVQAKTAASYLLLTKVASQAR
jgi:hypothetical protein